MLYIFDVDGTLIEGFIVTEACPSCNRTGVVYRVRARKRVEDKCPRCKGKGFVFSKEHLPYDDVEVLPKRRDKIRELAENPDAKFAIATNQAGPQLGFQTFAQVYAKMGRVLAEFEHFHGRPVSVHMSMSHEKAKDPEARTPEALHRRKPNPGMLEDAMAAHFDRAGAADWRKWSRANTCFVGDLATDGLAAERAGVAFYFADEFFDTPVEERREATEAMGQS
jgi:histidinol phosphatase-like enzyme